MRDNGPVTQREVVMGDDSVIVSKTDDKGRIQFVNKDFLDMSGFKEEELIGQPHNLIRHSDMPPEAFKDMWSDLSTGKPWSGYVKNRIKNGDHYWVHANAMPVIEGGRITGFVSIRSKPDSRVTKAVGDLYKKFIDGTNGTLRIEHGQIVDTTSKAKWARWYTKLGSKMTCLSVVMCLMILVVAGLGVYALRDITATFKTVYFDRTVASGELADVSRQLHEDVLDVSFLVSGAQTDSAEAIKRIESRKDKTDKMWTVYMSTYLTPEEAILAKEFEEKNKAYNDEAIAPVLEKLKAGSISEVGAYLPKLASLMDDVSEACNKLIDLQMSVAKEEYEKSERNALIDTILLAVGVLIAAITAFISSNKIKALFNSKIEYVDSTLNSIAGGNLTTNVEMTHDEFQSIFVTIKALQAKLLYGELEKTELARLAKIGQMKLADDFDQRTSSIIKSLAAAATEMQATAAQMTAASTNTAHASQIVASAATEADSNVQTVAAATEELSASSSEIARQISSVAEKSTRASGEAVRTSQQVGELNSLADSIGEVVGAIKGIAEQTNLLALNATIEAARAGEAGKGFAVVADEVKKLATETASKTIQIDERVGKIQSAIRATVEAVGRIISDVNDIDHSTATVASAVEEQNAATAEIGRNVSEASTGTQQVAQNIVDVQKSAEETGEAANNLNQAANELAEIAENLQEQVATFLGEIRAA